MHSTHAAKLKKLLETMEQLGFESIGVWLSDSMGRKTLHLELKTILTILKEKTLKQKEA